MSSELPAAYSINDAARRLSIGRSSLYALINSGELKPIKLGGRTLIVREEIDALLERARAGASVTLRKTSTAPASASPTIRAP